MPRWGRGRWSWTNRPPARNCRPLVRDWVRRKWILVAVAASAMAVLGIAAAELRGTPSAVESFWNPVWGSADSVMMALGGLPDPIDPPPAAAGVSTGPTFRDIMRSDRISLSDALTMARLIGDRKSVV